MLIVTFEAVYYVDTLLLSEDRDDKEKHSDAFGRALNDWWDRYFTPHEARDSPLLRYNVLAFKTDHVTYHIGANNVGLGAQVPKCQAYQVCCPYTDFGGWCVSVRHNIGCATRLFVTHSLFPLVHTRMPDLVLA